MSLERSDGMTDRSGDENRSPIEWEENLSLTVVPLVLPEPSPKPVNVSAVTYTIQAYLTTKDGESICSNPIKAQIKELYEPSGKCFYGIVGEKINISPSEWLGLDADTSLDIIGYYMLNHALDKGEGLDDKTPLSPLCGSDECEIAYDEDTVTISFKQPGEYFMAVNLYGGSKAAATGYFVIEEKPDSLKNALIIAGIAVVAVAAVIFIVSRRKRSEREL